MVVAGAAGVVEAACIEKRVNCTYHVTNYKYNYSGPRSDTCVRFAQKVMLGDFNIKNVPREIMIDGINLNFCISLPTLEVY